MDNLIKTLCGLAALAFLLAVVGTVLTDGWLFNVSSEAFSRACTNLALLAIAGSVATGRGSGASG